MKNKLFAVFIILAVVGFASVWIAGGKLSSPALAQVGVPPSEHAVENVVFEDVHGWYFPAKNQKACILLMHGVRSNRREMLDRAIFLTKEGYSSFVIDLQGHGKTPGNEITFGYRESESARSAIKYLNTNQSCGKVVAIGSSLGGAASLLGYKPIKVDGYILESVYSSIETAVENRLEVRLGLAGKILAPLFYQQIPLRLGIDLDELQPISAIKNIQSPVLIIIGSKDKRTKIQEAKLMYENAPHPKELIEFNGASHTNLFKYDPTKYKKVVLEFLTKHIDVMH